MPETERRDPLPRPESGNNPRFRFGLLHEAAELLERYGYPPPIRPRRDQDMVSQVVW